MMILTMIMGQELNGGTVWEGENSKMGEGERRVRSEHDRSTLAIYDNSIRKPTKYRLKRGRKRGT
jgi:hypothetical protein